MRDRWGHEIYLTEERWRHIVERHDELMGMLDEVLEALRHGMEMSSTYWTWLTRSSSGTLLFFKVRSVLDLALTSSLRGRTRLYQSPF